MQKRIFTGDRFEKIFSGKTVVILDDDKSMHDLLVPYFEDLDMSVTSYYNSEDYISGISEFEPSNTLIISDVQLDKRFDINDPLGAPGGFLAMNETINVAAMKFPAVVLTSFSTTGNLQMATKDCGALGILSKNDSPVHIVDVALALALGHWLQLSTGKE